METLRAQSKLRLETINCGSLQRIADATELMARSHADLIAERDKYLKWYEREMANKLRAQRYISSLRGVITKLRKKLNDPSA